MRAKIYLNRLLSFILVLLILGLVITKHRPIIIQKTIVQEQVIDTVYVKQQFADARDKYFEQYVHQIRVNPEPLLMKDSILSKESSIIYLVNPTIPNAFIQIERALGFSDKYYMVILDPFNKKVKNRLTNSQRCRLKKEIKNAAEMQEAKTITNKIK